MLVRRTVMQILEVGYVTALPSRYVAPMYLFEELRRAKEGRRKGYVVLSGPAGSGKTVAMQALAAVGELDGTPVLAQFLPGRPDLIGDEFLEDLAAQIHARWPVTLPPTRSLGLDFDVVERLLPQVLRAL